MSDPGLDAEKLQLLRGWGGGLQNDPRAEVAAAGKAIMLLIDEIERLHVRLWGKQLYPDVDIPHPDVADHGAETSNLHEALRERLQRGSSDAFPQPKPAEEAVFHRESPRPQRFGRRPRLRFRG